MRTPKLKDSSSDFQNRNRRGEPTHDCRNNTCRENWIASHPHLLAAHEQVRVVVRDPSKLAPEIREKVETVTGPLDDEAVLQQALEGAESVFLVVPPSFTDHGAETRIAQNTTSTSFREWCEEVLKPAVLR